MNIRKNIGEIKEGNIMRKKFVNLEQKILLKINLYSLKLNIIKVTGGI